MNDERNHMNPDPNFNLELLVSSVRWARAEYERGLAGKIPMWNQEVWMRETDCGTQACLAGRAVLASGYKPVRGPESFVKWREGCPLEPDHEGDVAVDYLAQALFGITSREADALFRSSNSIADLESMAAVVAVGHGYEWPAA